MANMHTIAALKADFAKGGPNEIIANGRQEISGPRLNNVLLNIIDTLDYVLAPEGVGIESIHQNADSSLTFTLTDGTTFTTIPLKGEKGDPPVITADEEGNIYADGQFVTSIIRDTLAQVVSDVDVAVARANEAAQAATQKAALAEAAAATASTAAAGADAKAALAQAAADNADAKAALAASAAAGADTAAGNANAKAALADAAATIANQKAELADDAATLANQKADLANEAAGAANEAAGTANAAAEAADEAREGIQEDLDKKANKDGWYQTLTSGLSENLVDTKGAGTEQEFTDRTSCGEESIADDGSGIIKELRGNSIVWNQLMRNGDFSGGTTGWSASTGTTRTVTDGILTVEKAATDASIEGYVSQSKTDMYIANHKYFSFIVAKCNNEATEINLRPSGVSSEAAVESAYYPSWTLIPIIWTRTGSGSAFRIYGRNNLDNTKDVNFSVKYAVCIDLTLTFGAGKEPTTVAEFQAMYHELYYPQVDGTILNNAAATLVTDGFNQWDEEWEPGYYNDSGRPIASTTQIRSKNTKPIPVFPNVAYCFTCLSARISRIFWYDIDGNFISLNANPNASVFVATSPTGAYYCRFQFPSAYGVTYNNDACVNLSWSGYRNGEYEPYWKRETGVDMRKIYGKLNGAGEMVQVFPAGGRSAGDVYDVAEIFEKKEADVRLAEVDMGTLTWTYSTVNDYNYFRTTISTKRAVSGAGDSNLVCSKYATSQRDSYLNFASKDKAIMEPAASSPGVAVAVKDAAYTDAVTFAAAMAGVKLIYELAEPLHYTDLMYSEDGGQTFVDIPTVFKVADFGTERIEPLVDAQGNPVTAPFRAVIKYSDDFTRTIVNLPKNFDTTGGLDDLLAELSSVLGTALNGTLSIARGAYNPATKKYAWSVSFTPNE